MKQGAYFDFHEGFDAIPLIFDEMKGFYACVKPKYRSCFHEISKNKGFLFWKKVVKIPEAIHFVNEGTAFEGVGHRIILMKIKYGVIVDCEFNPSISIVIETFGTENRNLKVEIFYNGVLKQISAYQPQTVLSEKDMANGHWTHYLSTEEFLGTFDDYCSD